MLMKTSVVGRAISRYFLREPSLAVCLVLPDLSLKCRVLEARTFAGRHRSTEDLPPFFPVRRAGFDRKCATKVRTSWAAESGTPYFLAVAPTLRGAEGSGSILEWPT